MSMTGCAYRTAAFAALVLMAACGSERADASAAGVDLCALLNCVDGVPVAGGLDASVSADTPLFDAVGAGSDVEDRQDVDVEDAALALDAADAGLVDAGPVDAGQIEDIADAAEEAEVGPEDAGIDTGTDPDGGPVDAEPADAAPDAGDDASPDAHDTRDDATVDADATDTPDTRADAPFDASDDGWPGDGGADAGRDATRDADVSPDVDAALDAAVDADADIDLDAGADLDTPPDADADADGPDPEPVTARLDRIAAGAVDLHDVATEGVSGTDFSYGYGLTPLDADGDGDLDLFVGTLPASAQRACIYENVSTPGAPLFRRNERWCAPPSEPVTALYAADADQDGALELVALSDDAIWSVTLDGGWASARLTGIEDGCTLGSAAFVDADHDGTLELQTGCIPDFRGRRGPDAAGTLWAYDAARGAWAARDSVFAVVGGVIGLAVLDADADGLLDLVTTVDTLATPERVVPTLDPGGIHRRCPPDAACEAELVRLAPGLEAWGSFMGFEQMPGASTSLLFGDIGPFASYRWDDAVPDATPSGVDDAFFGDETSGYLYSWAVIADDWDADGDVDFFSSFGTFGIDQVVDNDLPHLDLIFTNDGVGAFAASTHAGYAFADPADHPDRSTGTARSSRSAVRFDVDGNGMQELIVAAANGPPFVYQHTGVPSRCTVRATSRYVATAGEGLSWVDEGGRVWPGPTGGESLTADPPWLFARTPRGTVRFASGYEADVDCADGEVQDVVEPEWLTVERDAAGRVTVTINRTLAPGVGERVEVAVRSELGVDVALAIVDETGMVYQTDAAPAATSAMIRIDGRWVARWFALP